MVNQSSSGSFSGLFTLTARGGLERLFDQANEDITMRLFARLIDAGEFTVEELFKGYWSYHEDRNVWGLEDLAAEGDRVFLPAWEPMVLGIVDQVQDPDRFIRGINAFDPHLAARCIRHSGRQVCPLVYDAVAARLERRASFYLSVESSMAKDSLRIINRPIGVAAGSTGIDQGIEQEVVNIFDRAMYADLMNQRQDGFFVFEEAGGSASFYFRPADIVDAPARFCAGLSKVPGVIVSKISSGEPISVSGILGIMMVVGDDPYTSLKVTSASPGGIKRLEEFVESAMCNEYILLSSHAMAQHLWRVISRFKDPAYRRNFHLKEGYPMWRLAQYVLHEEKKKISDRGMYELRPVLATHGDILRRRGADGEYGIRSWLFSDVWALIDNLPPPPVRYWEEGVLLATDVIRSGDVPRLKERAAEAKGCSRVYLMNILELAMERFRPAGYSVSPPAAAPSSCKRIGSLLLRDDEVPEGWSA